MSPEISRLKGKINRWIGVATGDRDHEARGAFQEAVGHNPSESQQENATHAVKAKHHDYGERIPPQRVSHVDRAPAPRHIHRPHRAT